MKRKHEQIRLHNLELLINEAGSAIRLARLAGTNSSYISQVRHQMPTKKGTPRGVGDDLAEKLERGMKKPEGWMDEPHVTNKQINLRPGPGIRSLHPVISWIEAREWAEIAEDYTPQDEGDLLPCPIKCSEESFVLRIRGISMEPKFHDGDLIFVDPDVEPVHGKYVVVRLEDSNEATFKQLIVEDGMRYLKALNPDWPVPLLEINATATICGVVVFKGEVV
jgi:SOS-response transcriptional repressor LexA